MNNLTTPKIPKRIFGLDQLASNLWWSWHPEARNLFKALDRPLWKATIHNPVQLLQQVAPYRLVAAAEDIEFLKKYDSVMNKFSFSMTESRYQNNFPDIKHKPIAYFSMEFALHNSLPLYAGGLGVLAGDYCKEASDQGVPLVGIGFMYPQGYFRQHITEDGWQEEIYKQLNFEEAPISPILNIQNQPLKITIELDTRLVHLTIWQITVGQVKLYLLDTNLAENYPADRNLSARLYDGDREKRLQQEILLGIGGVRILRELQINPSIWHANEGHSSFMMLERCRELVEKGLNFAEARQQIQSTTVFTTHTPVSAGNDVFSHSLIEKYFHRYWSVFGLSREDFLELGTQPSENANFNMTVLAEVYHRI